MKNHLLHSKPLNPRQKSAVVILITSVLVNRKNMSYRDAFMVAKKATTRTGTLVSILSSLGLSLGCGQVVHQPSFLVQVHQEKSTSDDKNEVIYGPVSSANDWANNQSGPLVVALTGTHIPSNSSLLISLGDFQFTAYPDHQRLITTNQKAIMLPTENLTISATITFRAGALAPGNLPPETLQVYFSVDDGE